MIKLPGFFWSTHVRSTEYDIHRTGLEDIESFLKDTVHKSAKVYTEGYIYYVRFAHPKYETLFRLKYSDYIV